MQAKIFVLPLALMIIFFSGCTLPGQQTTSTVTGQSLTIESFAPEYNYVAGGDDLDIVLKVRNTGGRDINGVRAEPYLLAWSGYTGTETCTTTPLYKPNPEINRLGSPCTLKWQNVQVPEVSKEETFQVGTKVEYDYATEATATVYALTANMYNGYMERGEDVRSVKTVDSGTGPILIDVKVDDVLIYGSGNNNLPVTLVFTNTGGSTGKGYPKGSTDREFEIESVDVSADSASGISTVDTSDCQNVRMRGGTTGDCTIQLSVGSGTTSSELIVHLKITAEYTYVEPVETYITVHPSLSSSGGSAGTGSSRNP